MEIPSAYEEKRRGGEGGQHNILSTERNVLFVLQYSSFWEVFVQLEIPFPGLILGPETGSCVDQAEAAVLSLVNLGVHTEGMTPSDTEAILWG